MEPASSDSDDSSVEQVTSRKMIPRDDDDSSSASDNDDDDDSSSDEEIQNPSTTNHQNFEDLPSEDSCMEDVSDDDESDGEEDVPLSERIHSKRNDGIIGRSKKIADKKSRALAIAQIRLSEMKQKKKRKKGHHSDSDDDDDNDDNDSDSDLDQKQSKKKSKHAPTIASSSRKAFYQRGAPDLNSSGIGVEIGANKYKARDPRMQSLSGHYDQNVFERRYDFLEKMQDDEIDRLKVRCKAWKTTGRKGQRKRKKLGMTGGNTAEEDEEELKRMIAERATRRDARVQNAAKRSVKKKLRDEVASGKRGAYHLKRSDMKKLELEAKFEELRKIGGDSAVNKVLSKRRKRKMGKDSGLMPNESG
jgi:ribosomal RNA-processing protein 36